MRGPRFIVPLFATTLAGSALAAGDTIPKRGLIYAWTEGGLPSLRSEPKTDAPEVGHAPNGGRVRFVEVTGTDAAPTWYHVDQLGIASGWLDGKQARADAPARPAAQGVPNVDLGNLRLHTGTVQTSAARGLDARVLGYGQEGSREDALQQLADLRSAVDHQMADVPYDGSDGKHRPGSRFNHTAKGRQSDAQAFRDGLAPGGAK